MALVELKFNLWICSQSQSAAQGKEKERISIKSLRRFCPHPYLSSEGISVGA